MGGAIVDGLLADGIAPERVTVTVKSEASADKWRAKKVNAIAVETHANANATAVANAELVLVAVKPSYVVEVLSEAATHLKPDALVISVAAGITTEAMQNAVPASVAVIRAMPNTPSVIKLGMTGIAAGSRASADQLKLAEELFAKVGKTLTVDESQIDALSTVSGSGPAYVFYFIEQLTTAAEKLGFTNEQATLLVTETFRGAGDYLMATGKSAAELRAQVTSPNGTTMRAIAELEKLNLAAGFEVALNAALTRAKELASGQ
jgi:pyrroline-5-carboxylate reductase